jgi:thiamine pyrophosphokinase
VYAADGGAWICKEAGVTPEWVVGDFDSVDPSTLPQGWDVRTAPDQNQTDFEKLLASLPEDVNDLLVLGGLGKRVDHLLTNLLIAAAISPEKRIRFEDAEQVLWRVTGSCPWSDTPPVGEDLSLIPIPGAVGVTTKGLYWDLKGQELKVGGQLGQSNRVTGPVDIEIERGVVYVWRKRSPGDE